MISHNFCDKTARVIFCSFHIFREINFHNDSLVKKLASRNFRSFTVKTRVNNVCCMYIEVQILEKSERKHDCCLFRSRNLVWFYNDSDDYSVLISEIVDAEG